MDKFSPNMLKTFEDSPENFFSKYVEKVSLPQRSKIFEKGKKVHALASYYLQGMDIAKLEKVLNDDETVIWNRLKNSNYFAFEVINTEYDLSCKVGDFWIGGRLDAFVENKRDYYILDYKTGQIPKNAETDFQTITYLLCADKLLKGNYNSLRFVYLGLKNDTEKEIIFSENLKKEYEEKIISTCKNINTSFHLV